MMEKERQGHVRQSAQDAREGTEGLRFVLVLLQPGLRLSTCWVSGRSWAGVVERLHIS